MKSKLCRHVFDIMVLFSLRIKLIMKDFTTVTVLGISIIVFALMIKSMTASAEDLSSIPIGIVDNDNSNSSKKLIAGLKQVETLRVTLSNEDKLKELMLDEAVYGVFVIEKGYEEKLKSGNMQDAVTMYYKKKNTSISILSDIVAGEIIYPVNLYKSYRYYEQIPYLGQKHTFTEYQDYMNKLMRKSKEFDFSFRIHYVNQERTMNVNKNVSNSVLYNQCVFGIIGILIAFVAMFLLSQTVKEKEMGVDIRLKISDFHILKRDMANLCALLFLEGIISFLFTGLIFHQLQIRNVGLWFSTYLLMLLNALVLGTAMQLIAKAVKKMLLYQVLCSILILLTGGIGFYDLVNAFYHGISDNMIKIIPNSWFIKGFTDIIVYGSNGGYPKEGHRILLVMAAVLIFLIIGIDLIWDFHNKINKNRMVTINGQKD